MIRTSALPACSLCRRAGILLQRALPRDGHGKDQRIERWMVEALAHQPAGRQKDPRSIVRQRLEGSHQRLTLYSGYPALQHKGCRLKGIECRLEGVEVLHALGEDQHFATLRESVSCHCLSSSRDVPAPGC
jgi:hypothetical protein